MSRNDGPRRLAAIATVDATGTISFGFTCPKGEVTILKADDETLLRRIIEPVARHAYDGTTLLVPGVPEADDQSAAMDALIAWRDWVYKRLPIEPGETLHWAQFEQCQRPTEEQEIAR